MRSLLKPSMCALFVACLISTFFTRADAQQVTSTEDVAHDSKTANLRTSEPANARKFEELSVNEKLQRMEKLIESQQQEVKELRALVERIAAAEKNAAQIPTSEAHVDTAAPLNTVVATGTLSSEKKAEEVSKDWFNRIKVSGDVRFRFETFRNQGFDSPVEVPSRNRLRVRARLELKTEDCKSIDGPCFDFGLKLATGSFTDNISTNQTLTDFYERKPFALERAFVKFTWKFDAPWKLELTAGKFEPTFRRAQLVWDDDVNVEGISEALSFSQKRKLYGVKLVAFQLPFGEVPAGKDGMLYGAQLQTDWTLGEKTKADVNVGYYSWNHADQVLFGLGAATTQVNGGISNSAAVTGGQNGALGTTNRIIRDPITGNPVGFVANFNLLDVLGNYVWRASDETPVKFTFDYVRNLSQRIDNENNGCWAGIEVHRTKCNWKGGRWLKKDDSSCDELSTPGDLLLGYTFARIQQDAVLVPFNFSDILASNSRAHMLTFAYVPRNSVVLQWTGIFSQRANKVFLLSPVNRWLNRMQFDVIYKFK